MRENFNDVYSVYNDYVDNDNVLLNNFFGIKTKKITFNDKEKLIFNRFNDEEEFLKNFLKKIENLKNKTKDKIFKMQIENFIKDLNTIIKKMSLSEKNFNINNFNDYAKKLANLIES